MCGSQIKFASDAFRQEPSSLERERHREQEARGPPSKASAGSLGVSAVVAKGVKQVSMRSKSSVGDNRRQVVATPFDHVVASTHMASSS